MENIAIPGYVIKRKLGSGGMADVFLATQTSFDRDVAIKILSSQAAMNQDFAARFIREAKIVAGLSHQHIIPVYDVGQQDQFYYMSMDYLPGGDLEQWIKSGIPEAETLRILQQIAMALHYAHQKGYMHRDIKPGNIMFRDDNSAVLTDFGIARLQNADDQLTQAGMIVGTPTYMSPEAIKGNEPDGRADVYALGIVFYEMLMKVVPYKAGEFTALAMKHLQDPIPELPRAYAKYQPLLNKLLAKDAADRYQSGREVVKAVAELQAAPVASVIEQQQEQQAATSGPINTPEKAVNQSAVKPASNKQEKTEAVEDGVNFEESEIRKGLFKKRVLYSSVVTNDPHSLSVYFTKVSDRLVEWHKQHKDKVDSIEIKFITESWCFERADKLVMNLYKAGGVYEFLKKLSITVNMQDMRGSDSQQYTINKKGEKVSET